MADLTKKKLPVGIENFAEIRKENFYYVDKTGMIRDLLARWGKVNLFTRPRRFGKSLNMSMLKSFFEIGGEPALFDGLTISKETALCERYMGKYPVLSISLKSVSGADYADARSLICSVIGEEALRFYDVLINSNNINEIEKARYRQLVMVDEKNNESFIMPDSVLKGSLRVLSSLLEKHYGRKVIILLDEYDVPLAKASENGYYDEMIFLIRNLFEQAMKTNDSLYFAVLTGCLRVAKESIFTGLNNLKSFSITDVHFDEYFGFTDQEVKKMLGYYGLEDQYGTVKNWYDGYLFGNVDVYCPWDVICYCDEAAAGRQNPRNYWSNTSGNDIVRRFIERMGSDVMQGEMESLIAGETVEKEIHEDLTYNRLYDSIDNIWSVLFMTGYLTQRGEPEGDLYCLTIPNMEIRSIFTRQIMTMFKADVRKDGDLFREFCSAIETGNAAEVERLFTSYLKKTISIRDTFARRPTKENFYHGILLGILGYKNGWYLKSNKESGNGYSDISVHIEENDIGIIIEVKYAQDRNYDTVCREAISQIDRNGYADELKNEGCRVILKYGIACYKKTCRVVLEREDVS